MNPTVAVTGASGSIGRTLTGALTRDGWTVRRFVRHPSEPTDVAFDLARPVPDGALEGVEAIVHLAWPTKDRSSTAQRCAATATGELAAAGARIGARSILISSIAALSRPPSAYGAAKLLAEDAVHRTGGTVLRPGLILDGGGGPAVQLARLSRWPVVALPSPDRPFIYAVTMRDVVDAVIGTLTNGEPPQPDVHRALPLRVLVQRAGERSPKLIAPLPIGLVGAALRILARPLPPLRGITDSLGGLMGLPEQIWTPTTPFVITSRLEEESR